MNDEETTRIFENEPLDHEGTARCVVALYHGVYRYVKTHGWLAYNGRYWEFDDASIGRAIVRVLRLREDFIKAKIEDPKIAAGMRKQVACNSWAVAGVRNRLQEQKEFLATIEDFDNDAHLLNCWNGVLNLRTGDLQQHNSSQLFTHCLQIEYNPDAYCEDWIDFIKQVVPEDLVEFVQIMSGYFLTGSTVEEVMFYLYGPTRSGKGTYSEPILDILGSLAIGLNFKTFTADRTGDTQNFDLAPLKGRRLVIASESRKNERLNEAVLKQVTGGDNVYCANKGKPHFSYKPTFKILLQSNHPANVDANDAAAWGRLRVIHFPNSHLGTEDKDLKRRLKTTEALQGIFTWMVEGALAWYANGLPLPENIINLTARQRTQANSVAMFIDQCCTVDDTAFSPGTPLYHSYVDWAKEEGYAPVGRKNFTTSLAELGFDSDRQTYDGKVSRGYLKVSYSGHGLGDESITKRFSDTLR